MVSSSLSVVLLSGDLDAHAIAEHIAQREPWLDGIVRDQEITQRLGRVVDRIEAGDAALIARIKSRPDIALRLFALVPALPMLRIFNVIEQDDEAYLTRVIDEAPAGGPVPVGALAQARMDFLLMLNTLSRVLSRRAVLPDVRLPIGV